MSKGVSNAIVNTRPKVVILPDSHGRGVSKLLQETSKGALQASCWGKPNAKMRGT